MFSRFKLKSEVGQNGQKKRPPPHLSLLSNNRPHYDTQNTCKNQMLFTGFARAELRLKSYVLKPSERKTTRQF